jgi:hypothetical protein
MIQNVFRTTEIERWIRKRQIEVSSQFSKPRMGEMLCLHLLTPGYFYITQDSKVLISL